VVHVNNKAQYLVFPCLSSLDVAKTLHLLVESSKRPGQTRVNAALFATKKAPNKPRYFPSTRSGTFLKNHIEHLVGQIDGPLDAVRVGTTLMFTCFPRASDRQ
jgi:hypothetical protein